MKCFAGLHRFTTLEQNFHPAPFRLVPLMFGVLGKIWQGDSSGLGTYPAPESAAVLTGLTHAPERREG